MLKKSILLSMSIFFLLFVGSSDSYAEHKKNPNAGHGGGGGGDDGGDKYSVSVTFDDSTCGTDADPRDYFCSDGGAYSDGVDNVAAGGDKFRLGLTLKTGTLRSFFLDFSDNCVASCDGAVPNFGGGAKKGLTSGPSQNMFSAGEPGFSLLDMQDGVPQPRYVIISFRDDNNDAWVLSFLPDVCAGSNLVTVTRTNDTWDFVPAGGGIACLERRKNGKSGPQILQGLYRVPFQFTVQLLP